MFVYIRMLWECGWECCLRNVMLARSPHAMGVGCVEVVSAALCIAEDFPYIWVDSLHVDLHFSYIFQKVSICCFVSDNKKFFDFLDPTECCLVDPYSCLSPCIYLDQNKMSVSILMVTVRCYNASPYDCHASCEAVLCCIALMLWCNTVCWFAASMPAYSARDKPMPHCNSL